METAEMVLERRREKRPPSTAVTKNTLVVDGRIIDVKGFRKIHPGSEAAIVAFLKKDATQKFHAIGHPPYAYSYLFQLQKGFCNT